MIFEALCGFDTNNYLIKGQNFTVNWIEYEYYGTQIVSITLENGSEGFLFCNFSDDSGIADFPKGLFTTHFYPIDISSRAISTHFVNRSG